MKKLLFLGVVVVIAAMTVSSAFAGSRAVGVEFGYLDPQDEGDVFNSTWIAGVYMDLGLPAINWSVSPFVNYWNWSEDVSGLETSFRDWTVGANLKMSIPAAAVQPFIAAGASAHLMSASLKGSDPLLGSFDISEGETKFGFQLGGGAQMGVGSRTNIVASGWYHFVENVNQWSLRGGLSWNI